MKALVYHGPQQMAWQDWPEQQPGQGEVAVAVRAVGICGSDLRGYTGESGHRQPPLVMGHEASGEVVALGPGVPKAVLGRRVVLRPDLVCGTCEACRRGLPNRCTSRRLIGVHTQGAMAERVVVPAGNLVPLPDNVSFEHGTLVEPLAVGIHAVGRAGEMAGHSVLIAGSGPIGLLTLVAALQAGARAVVTTDIIAERRSAALALGASAALDPTDDRWRERLVDAIEGAKADVAFDAVGIAATLGQALEALRPGGVAIAIGGWQTVPLDLAPFVRHEIELRGSFNYTHDEFERASRWLAEGRLDAGLLVTDVRPLAEGAAVFAELAQGRSRTLKAVLRP